MMTEIDTLVLEGLKEPVHFKSNLFPMNSTSTPGIVNDSMSCQSAYMFIEY